MAPCMRSIIWGGRWSRRSSKSARARVGGPGRGAFSSSVRVKRAEGQDLVDLRGVETAGRRFSAAISAWS